VSVLDFDHWQEIMQTLRRNRLRTFLTACGVFWGVFMLLVVLGFARGLEKAVEQDFKLFALNSVFVWGQQTQKPYEGRKPGRRIQLTLEDLEAVRRVEGVQLALARNFLGGRPGMGGGGVVSRGEKSGSYAVSAEEPDYLQMEPMEMRIGRFLNPVDIQHARKVAVIGPRVAETLFAADESPIGQTVLINRMIFEVVGVYHTSETSGPRGDFFAGRVFVPRTTFARAFSTGNRIGAMALLIDEHRPSTEVEEEVRTVLRARQHVDPTDSRALGSFNREKEFRKLANLFFAIRSMGWFVGVLTLLAGAIGVSNIMMIAVSERTREIGIRKAIGATPATIMAQIILESTVLTALAGYLAVVCGVGLLEVVARIVESLPRGEGPRLFAAPEVELGKALAAAAVLTIAGALAGLAPARAAVAVRPVEALAHE
jgi:putative ABC transport system permease protein